MVIMKQNIKLLIESLFDDVDIFDDDDSTILMDSYERISKYAIEDLERIVNDLPSIEELPDKSRFAYY